MMPRRVAVVGASVLVAAPVVLVVACRLGQPTGDPRTPPNSPIPVIDSTEKEPKTAPAPSGRDAG